MNGVKKMFPREKQFADLLDKQNRKWQYPSPRFEIEDTHYRPDFYLPDENLYIEVVGSRQAYHANKRKIEKFRKLYPHIKFIIVDYKNKPLKLCGERDKNNMRKNKDISIKISSELYRQVKACAKKEWRTIKGVLEIAIAQYLQKNILSGSLKYLEK